MGASCQCSHAEQVLGASFMDGMDIMDDMDKMDRAVREPPEL